MTARPSADQGRWWPTAPGDVYAIASAALFAFAAIVVALTFTDYGVTWDAEYHRINANNLVAYWTSLFADRSALEYHNLYLYGGAFDLLSGIAARLLPLGEFEASHLCNALVGLVGVAGAWKLARYLAGSRAAFWAALLLLLTPAWYGHMFNNPKDIPFAAGLAWTLYYMVRTGDELPRVSWPTLIKLGLVFGLTLGVRIGGVIAGFYLLAGLAAYLLTARRPFGAEAGRIVLRLLPAMALAYVVMVLCWPWAQQDPLANPFRALLLFAHVPWDIDVLFEGHLVNSMHLPWDYLFVYFGIELPELVLVLLLAAPLLWLRSAGSARNALDLALRPSQAALLTAILFPFVYFLLARPVVYDGLRHFLFALPPLAVAAGIAADRLLTLTKEWATERAEGGWQSRLSPALAAALVLAVGLQTWRMAELHPNEYVYYNALVGGTNGAEGYYELDYWGNSYAEAVRDLTGILDRESLPSGQHKTYKVLVCSSGVSASYFFPPYLSLTGTPREADFYIASTRLDCDDEYDGTEIVRVERDHAVLSVVKDRRLLKLTAPARLDPRGPVIEREHPMLVTAGHQP